MVAASGPPGPRPRWRSVRFTALWLAVHAGAVCVAGWVAGWLVPLPPRPPPGQSVEAWAQAFNHFFHTFFAVYVSACIVFLYAVGIVSLKCGALSPEDFTIHRSTGPTRGPSRVRRAL